MNGDAVVLSAEYVAQNVDLAYATTTHRAQGLTVDRAHVLAAPGMTRENLYVAMTRGRQDNRVYVAVDDVDPACDYLPDIHAAPDGRAVLAGILATSGAELSATQTIAARQNAVGSLKRLEPIRQTLLADATARRWISALRRAGLGDAAVEQITTSPACGSPVSWMGRVSMSSRRTLSTGTPSAAPRSRVANSEPHAARW